MSNNDAAALTALPFAILAVILLFAFAMMALMLWLWSRIFSKAGHTPWLALILLIPLANLVMIFWFALSTWPIENEVQRLRQLTGGAPRPAIAPGAGVTPA